MGGGRGSQENDLIPWTLSKASVKRVALTNKMENMRWERQLILYPMNHSLGIY